LWLERRLLRWLGDAPSVARAAATVLACAAAISVVFVGPILLGNLVAPAHNADPPAQGLTMQMGQPPLPEALGDLAVMNLFTLLPLLLLFLGAASFAIHRFIWWIVLTLSYGAQKERFLTGPGYKKWARAVGLACLLYGLRIIPDALVGTFAGH
jgi:hypothetical protein